MEYRWKWFRWDTQPKVPTLRVLLDWRPRKQSGNAGFVQWPRKISIVRILYLIYFWFILNRKFILKNWFFFFGFRFTICILLQTSTFLVIPLFIRYIVKSKYKTLYQVYFILMSVSYFATVTGITLEKFRIFNFMDFCTYIGNKLEFRLLI